MRGTSATSVSNLSSLLYPLSISPPPPLCGPSRAHRLRASFFETCPLFVLKKKSFWCQGHAYHQTPGASPSVALDLAFTPAFTVACLV